jgi:DNA-binding NarL/FixJ family response regulator
MSATPVATAPPTELGVLVVDDHPALRAGLEALLAGEPGLRCVGTLAGTAGLAAAIHDARPDVVVLDYALASDDGLAACFRIKQQPDAPGVVLYTAYSDPVFAVPAAVAQADATVAKSAPVAELLGAIRAAGDGVATRPAVEREMLEAASARLVVEDLPVAAMLLGATPIAQIAETLGLSAADVRSRALRIIGRLQSGQRLNG